jgi:serine/threonine-protein phosphatase 2A regulatory subunit B
MFVDSGGEVQWYFSQVKGTMEDEVNEADVISTVEFNEDGELLATGDKGGRIVIFQRDQPSKSQQQQNYNSNNTNLLRSEYNVYSTFQSHEAEFDYLKSLEIEEKINKIKWLKRKNDAHFLLSTNDKTIKLWKIRERNKRAVFPSNDSLTMNGSHVSIRDDMNGFVRSVNIPVVKYMDRIEVEAIPKRIFANAHTYHINSISLNSDQETFMSADDLRINLWHIEITNQSFNIVDIKPANMEELTEVITAAEFHPIECNLFVYSSSKGIIRLCDMRQSALCDTQAKSNNSICRKFFVKKKSSN